MKKTLHLLGLLFCAVTVFAQSNVSIQINHLLDGAPFEMNKRVVNDLGQDFMVDRLEYYISGFSITHNGGEVINIPGSITLVDLSQGSDPTVIDLGMQDIANLESISFYFGLNNNVNHGDPSIWPVGHPLAPKFPSMHWGWAAGYRFIAIEGKAGTQMNQVYQLHCVGDQFYKEMTYQVDMAGEEQYMVSMDAEYTALLKGINVSSGLIIHGDDAEINDLASNIMTEVFTLATSTNLVDSKLVQEFKVYPNPSFDHFINFDIAVENTNVTLDIVDMLGRSVYVGIPQSGLQIEQSGFYFANLKDESGKILATRKIVIQ